MLPMNEELAKLSAAMLKKVQGMEAEIKELKDEQILLREGIKSLAQCQKNYGDHRGDPIDAATMLDLRSRITELERSK